MKKLIYTLTLLCFGLLVQAQIPNYVPTNGLVGWWPFNGNANDESGNGNNGTVNGATLAADRFGNSGKAYSFDGVSSRITSASFFNAKSNYSISIWTFSNNNKSQVFINTDPHTLLALVYYPFWNTQGIGFLYGNGNSGGWINNNYSFPSSVLLQNNWTNLILVKNDSLYLFYQNGNLIHNHSEISTPANTTTPVIFGNCTPGICNDGFSGLLDDIAIYNRALSASEVQQLYLGACAKPTFTAQLQNKSVAQGQTTTFAVQVDSASRYQWQMNQGYGQNWVNLSNSAQISGVTTHTLNVEGRYQIDGAQFRCIATSCNADTSNAATLTVSSSATAAAGTVAGVPGLINYQGSALDSAGKPMKNQTISLKLSVLDSSSTGAAVYVESHSTATNGSGHFAIQIGGGTAILGKFDSVGWANGRNKYLKTELSQNGTWVSLGTSQLVSVPYALHAGSAENATNASYANFFKDSLGNAYQIKTVNGQPTLVAAPGSGSASNPGSFACGQSVTYAGESYPTVQIGTQCWFQKNLNVGTMILGANDQTNNSTLEKYCYNNDPSNCAIYGGLFQWAEAVQYQNGASNTASPSPAFSGNVKGICPTGWHVPSDGEWCTLTTYLDSTVNCGTFAWSGTNAGGKMKLASSYWFSSISISTNSSGFSSIPSGSRNFDGSFGRLGDNNYLWTSEEGSSSNGIGRDLFFSDSRIGRNNFITKSVGWSIRCLKD